MTFAVSPYFIVSGSYSLGGWCEMHGPTVLISSPRSPSLAQSALSSAQRSTNQPTDRPSDRRVVRLCERASTSLIISSAAVIFSFEIPIQLLRLGKIMATHAIQKVTHNLPAFVSDAGTAILGQECYTTLIYNVDLSSSYCLRLFVSKGLGIGIVVFGSLLKLPQIIKIVNAKSARGISFTMYALECWAYVVSLIYAYRAQLPFSTYGENASLTVQNFLITLLIIAYAPSRSLPLSSGSSIRTSRNSRVVPVTLASVVMLATTAFLLSPTLCPSHLLSILQATTIPVSLISKIPQMAELHRAKDVGNLSAIVVFMQLLGTIARVFTTMTETDDLLLLAGFGGATVFNG